MSGLQHKTIRACSCSTVQCGYVVIDTMVYIHQAELAPVIDLRKAQRVIRHIINIKVTQQSVVNQRKPSHLRAHLYNSPIQS